MSNGILLNVIIIDFLVFKKTTISLLYELINLRDNYLMFSGDFNLSNSDFLTVINYMSTVWVYAFVI